MLWKFLAAGFSLSAALQSQLPCLVLVLIDFYELHQLNHLIFR